MTPAALIADLRARGVTLEPRGDKLAVRPADRLTAEELDTLRVLKAEVLVLLTTCPAFEPVTVRGGDYAHPWPDALPALGPRRMGAFTRCQGCNPDGEPAARTEPPGAGWSWVAYGAHTLCLRCARRRAETGGEPGTHQSTPPRTGFARG